MMTKLKAALNRGIETLYFRYVWPKKMEGHPWSVEKQLESLRLEHLEVFRGRFEANVSLDSCGPIGQMFAEFGRIVLNKFTMPDGKPAPNYIELQLCIAPVWMQVEGEHAERCTITIHRCKGKTPAELKTEAERKAANYCARFDGLLNKLALAFDPSGDTDCDEATLLAAASMTRELREASEELEAVKELLRSAHFDPAATPPVAVVKSIMEANGKLGADAAYAKSDLMATKKTNGELGLAHTEALCEIGQLRSIIWHFALRANLAVADAMKQLNQPQQDKVREIWRDSADAHKRAEVPA